MEHQLKKKLVSIAILSVVLSLSGCGGGGGGSGSPEQEEFGETENFAAFDEAKNVDDSSVASDVVVINGSAVKGVIKNGLVRAYPIVEGIVQQQAIVETNTDKETGEFSLRIPSSHEGPVMVIVSGRGQNDPASPTTMSCDVEPSCGEGVAFGSEMALSDDFVMRALLPGVTSAELKSGAKINVNVTALTEIATAYAIAENLLDANGINTANSQIADMFRLNGVLTSFKPVDLTKIDSIQAAQTDDTTHALISAAILGVLLDGGENSFVAGIAHLNQQIASAHGQLPNTDNSDTEISLEEILNKAIHIGTQIDKNFDLGSVLTDLQTFRATVAVTEGLTESQPSPTVVTVEEINNQKSTLSIVSTEAAPEKKLTQSTEATHSALAVQSAPAPKASSVQPAVAKPAPKKDVTIVKSMVNDIRTLTTVANYEELETGAKDFSDQLNQAKEFIKGDTDTLVTVLEALTAAYNDAWDVKQLYPELSSVTFKSAVAGGIRIVISSKDTTNGKKLIFSVNQKILGFNTKVIAAAVKDDVTPMFEMAGSIQNTALTLDIIKGNASFDKSTPQQNGKLALKVALTKKPRSNEDAKVRFDGMFELALKGVEVTEIEPYTPNTFWMDLDQYISYCQQGWVWGNTSCDQNGYYEFCNYVGYDCRPVDTKIHYGHFDALNLVFGGAFTSSTGDSFKASFAINIKGNDVVVGDLPDGYVREGFVSYEMVNENTLVLTYPNDYAVKITQFVNRDTARDAGFENPNPWSYYPENANDEEPIFVVEYLDDGQVIPGSGFWGNNFDYQAASYVTYQYFLLDTPVEFVELLLNGYYYYNGGRLLNYYYPEDGLYALQIPGGKLNLNSTAGVLDAKLQRPEKIYSGYGYNNFPCYGDVFCTWGIDRDSAIDAAEEGSILGYGNHFMDFSFTLELTAELSSLSDETRVVLNGRRDDLETATASLGISYKGHRVFALASNIQIDDVSLPTNSKLYLTNQDGVKGALWRTDEGKITGVFKRNGVVHAVIKENKRGMLLVYYSDNTFESLQ